MSEAPVLARANKTATVVVLVVFLQLIVIAVLGMASISSDRREGEREARDRADADAVAVAEGAVRRMRTELEEVLREAAAVTTPEELRQLQARGDGKCVDLVYELDTSPATAGTFYWLTGVQRLWLPTRVSEDQEAKAIWRRDDVAKLKAELEKAQSGLPPDHLEAIRVLRSLLAGQALRKDPESIPAGFPDGLAWAAVLVEHARLALDEGKTPVAPTLREILLLAREVEAINRGRFATDETDAFHYMHKIQENVDSVIACEVDATALMEMVGELRRARILLDSLRPGLEEAGREYVETEATAGAPVPLLVLEARGETFAVQRSERLPDRLILVRILAEEARSIAAARVDQEALERQGVRLEVLLAGGALVGRPLWVRELTSEGTFELPLRAALYRDRPPPLPSGGPSEAFYLGIIALAALGLAVGAAVLVRMWRREVRLARLKADFVSNLSHELKTPLTSIALFTEMLQEGKLETEEEKAEGLAVLAQESQRLQRIVARMIDVARREARGTPYDLVPGDLTQPLREAALRFRRIVTEPGLELVVKIPSEPLPVRLDPAAVDDAVTNLLSNAWKYKRGDRARIELAVTRRRRHAEITVADDGIGIPNNERKRVFEMFYRAQNFLTRSVAGTGLGLALVRTIVRAHRGRIRVETGPGGVGTTFHIRLPLTRLPLPATVPTADGSLAAVTTKAPSAP